MLTSHFSVQKKGLDLKDFLLALGGKSWEKISKEYEPLCTVV